MKIGIIHSGYNSQRNFIYLPLKAVDFVRVYDIHKIISYLLYKLFRKNSSFHDNFFNNFGCSMVDGYHFFNAITNVKQPWIVTFETSLPRLRTFDNNTAQLLASNNCRAIIAISTRAFDNQCRYFLDHELSESIKKKMFVLKPTQEILVDSASAKNFYGEKLIVTFIGRHFYRKGGLEIMKAIERLPDGIDINIVSNMEMDKWRNDFISNDDVVDIERFKKNDRINYFSSLPNAQCLELLKKSHILLLPSFGETYGYTVLEGMAAGCVPIVTNLSSFSDFVNDENAFIIDLELTTRIDSYGFWDIDNPMCNKTMYEKNSRAIEEGVYSFLKIAMIDRELLEFKSNKSLEMIRQNHRPADAASRLEEIYNNFSYK